VSDGVEDDVIELVRRHGSVGVDVVVDAALYGPGGFYESGGSAGGRGGDFLTSVEVGPLFGAVLAQALDDWWEVMGRPDPFVVVDAGAGPGTLCRTVLAAKPECARALRYVLVERSAALRSRHAERIALEEPALAFAPVDPDTEQSAAGLAEGPICVSLAKMPRLSGSCIVVANELLDNLPFGLAEFRGGVWNEVRVTDDDGRLAEYLAPINGERAAALARAVPEAPDGGRVPLHGQARRWLQAALAVAGPAGRVVAFDYYSSTAALAARPPGDWLRTYRDHARGGPWLEGLGTQDITCEVAADQLAHVRTPAADRLQADWLHDAGIGELVEEGRRLWAEKAGAPDVAAMTARSRIAEAEALTDPDGLGAFRVLEWRGG
jgi:SAM-dependent MidA family methyltransferase